MSEFIKPGEGSAPERLSFADVNALTVHDAARLPSLRHEIARIQQRIAEVENLAATSAENRLPYGFRMVTYTGGAMSEVWRKNDSGDYAPYGCINTAGVEYPFIADGIQIVKLGSEEVALLTNEHFGIAVTAYEIQDTLQADDPNTEVLFSDFETYMEMFFLQDVHGKVSSYELFGPFETPQT